MDIKFYDDPVRYHREYYLMRRQEYIDYMGGGPCAQCGSEDSLEFDHVDPEQKSFNICVTSAMTDEVREELAKCQLLCADCHRAKSAEEGSARILAGGFTHGTTYGWMKRKCRCDMCAAKMRERNAARRGSNSGKGVYGRPSAHGEVLHYTRGCRCSDCRAANAERVRRNKASKLGEGAPG